MQLTRKRLCALACAATCLLSACGGGGGGGGNSGGGPGNGLTPFPTETTNTLPAGTRIDVSSKNLFQMGSGDSWHFTKLDAGGNPTGATVTRQVTAGPNQGHVSISDDDGGTSITTYLVSADGLLDESPLGDIPSSAKSIVRAIFEYATPLYPQGAERKHVRSGPWGEDLDGDGIGESFRYEFTQTFLGFETLPLSGFITLKDVAHFHNVVKLTLRPTAVGTTDAAVTATEDAWFAPGLGMVKAQRTIVDSDGFTLDPPHTIVFSDGSVAGATWTLSEPPPILEGSFINVPLKHNALVYDGARNLYYASVPGSVPSNGNRIATIDPTTGQVSFSASVGSEPDALAIAADASVLYVGLDGSNDVAKLALPAMTELGRINLGSTFTAGNIAVSPADPSAVAVSRNDGTVLLMRGMAIQPKTAIGGVVVAFDAPGTTLYGLGFGNSVTNSVSRMQVLADGLVQDLMTTTSRSDISVFGTRSIGFADNRVIAGRALFDAPALTLSGRVSSQSDCQPRRSGNLLMCFDSPEFGVLQARLVLADAGTFVIQASLLYAASEPGGPRRLVEGPPGQVAISYPANPNGFVSKIGLFTSDKLLTPPAPVAPSWPVTFSSTTDGQSIDIEIVHNSLVYDSVRNVYYASIRGSVIGAGNTIATIDPATGQVTHSAPIGSEPSALALAADCSVLYVGLDGSGEVLRLAVPSMTEQGRTRLFADPFFGRTNARTIAVSPADPTVAAVSMSFTDVAPQHAGVALLRDMVMQPKLTQTHMGSNLVAFDSAGTTLYGLNNETTEVGLRRIAVLADGLVEQTVVTGATHIIPRALSFANGRAIAGETLYDAPALTLAGKIQGATDCWATRSGNGLLCFSNAFGQGRVVVADSGTFAIGATLQYAPFEVIAPQGLVQGPTGQVAIYVPGSPLPTIQLFSSAQLP